MQGEAVRRELSAALLELGALPVELDSSGGDLAKDKEHLGYSGLGGLVRLRVRVRVRSRRPGQVRVRTGAIGLGGLKRVRPCISIELCVACDACSA